MGMKAMMQLKEMLCEELEKITKKGELSAGSLDAVHKLTDTVKNIDKIMMLEEEEGYSERGGYSMEGGSRGGNRGGGGRGGYSREGGGGGYSGEGGGGYSGAGDWEARGRFGGGSSYEEGGSSYANRGQHYVRGHYSREGGKEREESRKEMIGMFEDMMQTASGKDREIIQRAMDEMRRA